jgi:hypothetical protein
MKVLLGSPYPICSLLQSQLIIALCWLLQEAADFILSKSRKDELVLRLFLPAICRTIVSADYDVHSDRKCTVLSIAEHSTTPCDQRTKRLTFIFDITSAESSGRIGAGLASMHLNAILAYSPRGLVTPVKLTNHRV